MISINADGNGIGTEVKTAPGSTPPFDTISYFPGDL
jgi:hypothetical protein